MLLSDKLSLLHAKTPKGKEAKDLMRRAQQCNERRSLATVAWHVLF